jgi:hypothetical protein
MKIYILYIEKESLSENKNYCNLTKEGIARKFFHITILKQFHVTPDDGRNIWIEFYIKNCISVCETT